MPLYEYRAVGVGCEYCKSGFGIRQNMNENPLEKCPRCYSDIRRVIFPPLVIGVTETPDNIATERKIRDYEKAGMHSHAAELADKAGLGERARENYKKAGYDF